MFDAHGSMLDVAPPATPPTCVALTPDAFTMCEEGCHDDSATCKLTCGATKKQRTKCKKKCVADGKTCKKMCECPPDGTKI